MRAPAALAIVVVVLASSAGVARLHGQTSLAAGNPVGLRDALRQARAQSPARQASSARVEAAELSRTWAGRLLNPLAELRWENMAPGLRSSLPLDVFATITQPIELGGKRTARRGLADAITETAQASHWAVERSIDLDVARRFLAVVRLRDRRRALAEQADGLAELVRILERRVAEGTTAEADLRKLETERARVETDAFTAGLAAARELATLAALVGWTDTPPADTLERPDVPPPADTALDAAVDQALSRRADVRIAAARLESSRQHLRFEQARRIPDLNVTGGFKRTAGYDTSVVALLLPVPLFEHNRASIVLARGNVSAAELELEQTRRLAAAEARAAVSAARELARRATDAAAHLIAPATVVRAAARSAFTSGAGDLLRLVDAERVYADARLIVNDLAIEATLAAIEARLALAEEPMP